MLRFLGFLPHFGSVYRRIQVAAACEAGRSFAGRERSIGLGRTGKTASNVSDLIMPMLYLEFDCAYLSSLVVRQSYLRGRRRRPD